MSLFGYPATVVHFHSDVDEWGRPLPPEATERDAKVVEEQKLIKNAKGEDIQVAYEIHVEGAIPIGFDDYFLYTNALGLEIRCDVAHFEVRKFLGTDDVKKVIVYGRPQNI
ncbi:hypothetical protein [Paenibacillus brevis]|uniref:Uncharacterized protein n=1 Tax=Paenibacillus brevis TaxID=2841508 RepID=A0ABS6FT06_9BACL|nr:hypothetical protein [Paenibacillus brevis]MBU5673244.1 hypothetical protein [Paenibacillus brevis]